MSGAKIKDFDELTAFLGNYGLFQILIIVLLSTSAIPCGFMGMIVVFVSDTPEHHCKASVSSARNATDVEHSSWIGPDSCSRYKVSGNWTETEGLRNDTEPCLDGWVFSTERYTATIVSEWGLVCGDAWKVPFSTSLFFVGVLIGCFISGHLSDRFGRKPVFFLTMVLQAVTALIQATSVNWVMFCFLNCLRGLNQISNWITSLVLGSEMLNQSARVTYSMLGHSIGFAFGYALLPIMAYFIRGWRMLLVASAIPSLMLIPIWWVIPESPRWLLQKGRIEEAELVIRNAAKMNKVPAPEVIFSASECSELMKNKGEVRSTYTYMDLIRTRNMRNITIISIVIWVFCTIVYYGLSLNSSNLNGNAFVNCFISAIVDIVAYLAIWLLYKHVPRPTVLFSTMLFSGILLLIIGLIPDDMPVMFQVLALVGRMGVSGAYSFAYVVFTELIPTVVRNMGLGVASTAGRIGAIISPYVVYIGVHSKVLPFIIFGIASLVGAAIAMLLPDTKECKLPDLISEAKPTRSCCCPKKQTCTAIQMQSTKEMKTSALC